MVETTEWFSLFGDKLDVLSRRWEMNPDGWLCNIAGIAYARIARAWSMGLERLSDPDPWFPPFWKEFHKRYYFDPVTAEKLNGRYPKHYDWDGAWYPVDDAALDTWKAMMPYIRSTLLPLIEQFADQKVIPDRPVLHYRAGDVPFDRSPYYRLPGYGFYDWCKERVPGNRWLIVTRLDAMMASPSMTAASQRYLNDLRRHLGEQGIQTDVIDNRSPYDDLYTMAHGPYLMAAIFTSFSFFPGLGKPEGRYLAARSPYTPIEPPWMYNKPPLPHGDVDDYMNVESVLPLLRTL